MILEQTILNQLVTDRQYATEVMPYLKESYFDSYSSQKIFATISDHYDKYQEVPGVSVLEVLLEKRVDLNENSYKEVKEEVKKLGKHDPDINITWIMDETENFCKRRDLYNSLKRSIAVYEGSDKSMDIGGLPQLLSDSLSVSFDTNIGHDFFGDYEARYDFYNSKEERIPFDLDKLNKITKGGLARKSLVCYIAGCVVPETTVRLRISEKGTEDWFEVTSQIGHVGEILERRNPFYEVQVTSPDGWVKVDSFVEKGPKPIYELVVSGKTIRCSNDHLFETLEGFVPAEELTNRVSMVRTESGGFRPAHCNPTSDYLPVVDLSVDHPNHRYYTGGISSHNTGAGKTMMMCHNAGHFAMSGYNVLYITLEMAAERISERIDANLLDVTIDELQAMPKETYIKSISRFKDMTKSRLIVKEYPTGSANAAHFRHLINELRTKKGFVPDVMIVDYINLCNSYRVKNPNANSYTVVKAIAEELRGLAMEFNMVVVSATQTTRTGINSSDIDIGDTSECIEVGSKVTKRNGETTTIENLKPGDQIMSNDSYKTVMFVHHPKVKDGYRITTASGKQITVSENHVFPTDKGRVSISTGLGVGTLLAGTDG